MSSRAEERPPRPDCFADLHLDQVIASIVAGREEYELEPLFHAPLSDVAAIEYRHEVFRDLYQTKILDCLKAFTDDMRVMHAQLTMAGELPNPLQSQRCLLDGCALYCDAVGRLTTQLAGAAPRSRALRSIARFLSEYERSGSFGEMRRDAADIQRRIREIVYSVFIDQARITISHYHGEADYGEAVARVFEKFRRDGASRYEFSNTSGARMSQIEEVVLDRVARLNSPVFEALARYCDRYHEFLDPTVRRFEREIQFYLAFHERIQALAASDVEFCLPSVERGVTEVVIRRLVDISLANKLVKEGKPIVCNDLQLSACERVALVSGANQGGKTTFARAVGQVLYLAAIGCPVPAAEARVPLFDRLFTHFERKEDVLEGTSKLEADLIRIHRIVTRITAESVVIMNETFGSTTLADGLFLGREILARLLRSGAICLWVTFFDELTSITDTVVSLVSTVDERDPQRRTFQVVRKPADGMAHADAIARKYRVTYEDLLERISQ
jgi:hypothetical protein